MLHKVVFVAVLLLAGLDSFAQKVVFDLNGRVNFSQPYEYTKSEAVQNYTSVILNDTTSIRTYYESFLDRTNDYRSDPGFEINGLFTIGLSDRFKLRTGLGLNYASYSVGTNYAFTQGEIIRVDTVPLDTIMIFPGGSSCDCYENSFSEVNKDVDPRARYNLLNLAIPLEIGFDIVPGKLTIRAGGFFQTPVFTAAKREYVSTEMTTLEDMTKCKYIKVEEKNTAGTGISNFQWGVSGWINYAIFPNLQLEVGVRQLVNDVYVQEELQYFRYDNNSYKPLTFSAGLSYRLFNGASTE